MTVARFLLDEDLPATAAWIARGLGLDALSIHELQRRGVPDDEQLRFATTEKRMFVTRNRRDFLRLTLEFYEAGEIHREVPIVPRALTGDRPEGIAHALKRWADAHGDEPEEALLYRIAVLW